MTTLRTLTIAFVVAGVLSAQTSASRIVSLVPNLTDILLAIGARSQLVAVSSYDDDPKVNDLPRVGALLDPDVERIISLRPDLVLVYGSQEDLVTQLARAQIPTFAYRHGGLPGVTETIRTLGARVGRAAPAAALAASIEQRIAEIRRRTANRAKPRTLLVFGREPGALRGIYVSGGRGFLHDMLDAAGGANVYADVSSESVQVSSEMILTRAPDVIIEIRSLPVSAAAERQELDSWKSLAATPAVRAGRVYLLAGKSMNVPGPLVADGIERIARVLHPGAFK